jgi:T5SS/PEP-CTERM-associated repeat protein
MCRQFEVVSGRRGFSNSRLFPILIALSLAAPLPALHADITAVGDVVPATDPSTWISTTGVCIGSTAAGTLTITNGGTVTNGLCYIGRYSGSMGVVLVDGIGSTWTNDDYIYIGMWGSGTLTISNRAAVKSSCAYISNGSIVNVDGTASQWTTNLMVDPLDTELSVGNSLGTGNSGVGTLRITNGGSVSTAIGDIGYYPKDKGTVTVDGSGSVWSNRNHIDVGYQGTGTLNVTNGGTVSVTNGSLIGYYKGSAGTVTVAGIGSTFVNGANLSVGNSGSGTLLVANGGSVSNWGGGIGQNTNSFGVATVIGPASTWANTAYLYVGNSGSGTLLVADGGSVTSNQGIIGNSSGSGGTVTVDGAGSAWTNGAGLCVGGTSSMSAGSGVISITGGGTVRATNVAVNSKSLLAIDVGRGSLLTVGGGAGTVTDNGMIRVFAGAGSAVGGLYTPISAGSWSGTGTYQAMGGTWNTTSHKFTASSVASGVSGSTVPLELSSVQRAIVDDNGPGGTNWEVGASFVAATSTTNISFIATVMSDATLGTLDSQLSPTESILSGWIFSATGYTVSSSNPVYLSFQLGPGQTSENLDVWHYNGSAWTEYPALDLTYDGNYASFTANDLSGYAMVAVPEPSTLALLGVGAIGLLTCVWRRRRV